MTFPTTSTLRTRAFRVDTIVEYNYTKAYDQDVSDWYQTCSAKLQGGNSIASLFVSVFASEKRANKQKRLDPSYSFGTRYVTGISISDAVLRTSSRDSSPRGAGDAINRLQQTDLTRFVDWLEDDETDLQKLEFDTVAKSQSLLFEGVESPNMCDYLRSVIKDHTFLLTSLGFAVLVLVDFSSFWLGDEVWVLAGCSHPLILRPVPNEPRCYTVIHECYVHGIMDGEAARGDCPVLPADNDPTEVVRDVNQGRTSWPVPVWQEIELH